MNTDEILAVHPRDESDEASASAASLPTRVLRSTPWSSVTFSFADQAFAVGGNFLANVVLARSQTKEEYGMFALSYSLFTFFSGVHNAAILEPYTVYGSGRYRDHFGVYSRFMARSNAVFAVGLSGFVLLGCLLLRWLFPHLQLRAFWGLGLTVGVLLSGIALRRAFYVQRLPALAANTSLLFFTVLLCGLGISSRLHVVDSFSIFLILAVSWIAAGIAFAPKLALGCSQESFHVVEPRYWHQHWKYAKWVLVTALVFQLTTQGYYWVVAGALSVKDVANLRAIYLIIGPIEQAFIAISYLVLPALAFRYAQGKIDHFRSLWKLYALGVLVAASTFAFAVRLLGRPVLHLLYAGRFDDLGSMLFALAFFPLIMSVGNTMNHALKATENPRFIFFAYLSSGAATFLFGVPMVRFWGLKGAVYGMLLSGVVYTAALTLPFIRNVYLETR